MSDTTPDVTADYLARLDTELDRLPSDLHREILAGIGEELRGLDAAAASARIEQLGDPAFIAAGARDEMPADIAAATPDTPAVTPDAPAPGRTFSIVAVIVLVAGSLLVPVVGALAGLVFVGQARAWSRREKTTAWLVPVGVAVLAVATVGLLTTAGLGGAHLVYLVGYFVFPVVGIALAVRAARRGWAA